MKTNAILSIKFSRLKMLLGLPKWQVVGVLESLWTFTAINTPLGDIGRMTNEDIACDLEYAGDPDDLINALVKSGWLDKSEKHRLIVHDWHDHCPEYIKKKVNRSNEDFLSGHGGFPDSVQTCPDNGGQCPGMSTISPDSQGKSRQGKSNQYAAEIAAASKSVHEFIFPDLVNEAVEKCSNPPKDFYAAVKRQEGELEKVPEILKKALEEFRDCPKKYSLRWWNAECIPRLKSEYLDKTGRFKQNNNSKNIPKVRDKKDLEPVAELAKQAFDKGKSIHDIKRTYLRTWSTEEIESYTPWITDQATANSP